MGTLAGILWGPIPLRPKNVSGSFPLEGWHGKHEYVRYLHSNENPHLYNPEKGFIVSANYYPEVDFGFDHEGFFQPGERYARLNNLLRKK